MTLKSRFLVSYSRRYFALTMEKFLASAPNSLSPVSFPCDKRLVVTGLLQSHPGNSLSLCE